MWCPSNDSDIPCSMTDLEWYSDEETAVYCRAIEWPEVAVGWTLMDSCGKSEFV